MKAQHYFDARKGEPTYWCRNLPEELQKHREMVHAHEAVHKPLARSTPTSSEKSYDESDRNSLDKSESCHAGEKE